MRLLNVPPGELTPRALPCQQRPRYHCAALTFPGSCEVKSFLVAVALAAVGFFALVAAGCGGVCASIPFAIISSYMDSSGDKGDSAP